MKTLLAMRHAKSSWDDDGLSDHDRPLNSRGERDAPRMGRFLASKGLNPEAIFTSSALRAHQTAIAMAKAAPWTVKIDVRSSLYLAEPSDMISVLKSLPRQVNCALIVGHNPGIAEFVSSLVNEHTFMPTAAVAHIELPITRWQELDFGLHHKLVTRWYPKALPANIE